MDEQRRYLFPRRHVFHSPIVTSNLDPQPVNHKTISSMPTRKQNLQEYIASLNPALQAIAKSHLLNIFRANPWLSRFYADGLSLLASNSNQINNLQNQSEFFSNPDPKGVKPMSNTRSCTHIKVNGVRCGSPSLRGEVFCYFHQRMIRGVRTPPKSRLHPIALIEDEEGIQASLMEVINALIRNTIDFKRAQLILRALHIAVKNSPRVHFRIHQNEMIHEVPEYPAAPVAKKPPSPALQQAGALTRIPRPKPISITRPKPPIPAAKTNIASPKPPATAKPASAVRTAARRRTAG
jgi:hypothetical protein